MELLQTKIILFYKKLKECTKILNQQKSELISLAFNSFEYYKNFSRFITKKFDVINSFVFIYKTSNEFKISFTKNISKVCKCLQLHKKKTQNLKSFENSKIDENETSKSARKDVNLKVDNINNDSLYDKKKAKTNELIFQNNNEICKTFNVEIMLEKNNNSKGKKNYNTENLDVFKEKQNLKKLEDNKRKKGRHKKQEEKETNKTEIKTVKKLEKTCQRKIEQKPVTNIKHSYEYEENKINKDEICLKLKKMRVIKKKKKRGRSRKIFANDDDCDTQKSLKAMPEEEQEDNDDDADEHDDDDNEDDADDEDECEHNEDENIKENES